MSSLPPELVLGVYSCQWQFKDSVSTSEGMQKLGCLLVPFEKVLLAKLLCWRLMLQQGGDMSITSCLHYS
jgi:hypothetical protein